MTTITHAALVFTNAYSDKVTGSLYRNTAAGPNLPREITIKHQRTIDKATKKASRRSMLRVDRTIIGSDGLPIVVSAYMVVIVPEDPNVVAAHILDAAFGLGRSSQDTGGAYTGYDPLAEAVFVNGLQ